MAKSLKKLHQLVDKFVSEAMEYDVDRGLSKKGESDQDELVEILDRMFERKYGAAEACPFDVDLVDRWAFHPMRYLPVPYTHKEKYPDQLEGAIRSASFNLNLASDCLLRLLSFRSMLVEKQQKGHK